MASQFMYFSYPTIWACVPNGALVITTFLTSSQTTRQYLAAQLDSEHANRIAE
jgi:hypothetical protein